MGKPSQSLAIQEASNAAVRKYTADDLNAIDLRKARPVIKSLDELEGVRGKLLGEGSGVDYNDPGGEVRTLKTWTFELASGLKVSVIGAHQMNQELPELLGHEVELIRMGGERTRGGFNVNRYMIIDHGGAAK